ncbi:MAG: AmmeMemoRadiSam system radical SAM enzyme [Campylobacterales bacterium]|nr:AmmeMemoRadiSam system radical SAM enzyme [Campylobacterales bacterium]
MNYYESKADTTKLVCMLCSHYCNLKEEQVGICGVNKNTGNKIECLVYGYPSALNIDPIEKKPLYHFLPNSKSLSLGTIGCNFKCSFCQNWNISQEKNIDKSRYFSPQNIVDIAKEYGCRSIAYTYNEPTIFYPYAKDIALLAKQEGIKSVFVSNGYESSELIDDMVGLIDAANIDLKSFNEAYYKKELGGDLKIVLQNLKHFVTNKIWIEVTTLIVPTKNDSDEELKDIASFIADELGVNIPWHISVFHPDYKERSLPVTPLESLQRAYDIGKKCGLSYIYMGNIPQDNNTYCRTCNAKLISREGFGASENLLVKSRCPQCDKKLEGVFE